MAKQVMRTLTEAGAHIFPEQRAKIITMLESGCYPNVSMIARACKTTPQTIRNMFIKDPSLKERFHEAIAAKIDEVEESAIDLAINGNNEIAKQKAQEFILKHKKPEDYGENAEALAAASKAVRRIIVAPVLPTIAVDANGIPIQQNKTEPEVIDIQSESPLKDDGKQS